MKTLRDRTAVVTGAARGLGRGLSLLLAREGCRVALVDLETVPSPIIAGMIVQALRSAGIPAYARGCHLTNEFLIAHKFTHQLITRRANSEYRIYLPLLHGEVGRCCGHRQRCPFGHASFRTAIHRRSGRRSRR